MESKDFFSAADLEDEAIQAAATRVGADVLAQYQQLALNLRQKGRDAMAAMGSTSDLAERAACQCAFQLYGTAASELDDLIAELLDSLDRPFLGTVQPRTLKVYDGGAAGGKFSNRRP